MDSKPPPGAPQPTPISQPLPVSPTQASKLPFKLGIGPILAVATIALVVGFAIGKHDGSSTSSPAEPAASPAAGQSNGVPQTTQPPATQTGGAAQQGNAAEAKSAAVTAAEAMETCATDNRGSYSGCGNDDLVRVEPTLGDLGDRLSTSSTATSYKISVKSPQTQNEFTLERSASGTIARSCSAAGTPGCSSGGSW